MRYTGNFYNLEGIRYEVEIVTNNSTTQTRTIDLGVSPFVTSMDVSDENIYKPAKYQSATVKVVTSGETDYLFDVYSSTPNGTRVKLTDVTRNNVMWVGYTVPVVYQNGYSEVHEQLEIECIDGLSILQYYKYSTDKKGIVSFIDIINKILGKCGCYKTLYVSNNVYRGSVPVLNDLYISEQNFFDEKSSTETDDDVAWTMQEVLEEICQYLGYVAVADGESVWLLDYDDTKQDLRNVYHRYTIGSTAYTEVTARDHVEIEGEAFRGGDNTLSLDNVYNKVSVKDSFYTFDSVIPSLYDGAVNITASADNTLKASENVNNGMYGEVVSGAKNGNTEGDTNDNMIVLLDRVFDPQHKKYTDYNAVFAKYFSNPNYTLYRYDSNSRNKTTINYTDTKTMQGAVIAKFDVRKLEETFSNTMVELAKRFGNGLTLDDWLATNSISDINFSNTLALYNYNDGMPNTSITNYPLLQSNEIDSTALFGGENAYLVISGKYVWHYFSDDPYPIPQGEEIDVAEGRYAMQQADCYLLCKLQWGGSYWNGSAWTASNSTFKIPYFKETSKDAERRADATIFRDIDFVNTVTWRIGTDAKGYCIPTPTQGAIAGLPRITIYKPYTPNYKSTKSGSNYGQHYKHSVVFLKDFDIKAIIGDPTHSDRNETDTIYSNTINEHHAQELDEIEFKICTNDGKNPNYSSVAYKVGNTYYFVDTLNNFALGVNKAAEANLIERLVNQYSTPKVRLSLQLKDDAVRPWSLVRDKYMSGKEFIVDSQSKDYYNSVSTVVLVEK